MRDPDSWDAAITAEAYDEAVREGLLYRSLAERLVDLLAPRDGERILDLACGTGLLAGPLLARLGSGGALIGIDRAAAMLAVARRRHPVAAAAWLRADPGALPLRDASAAGATCSAAFWHFPARGRVWAELARVLTPEGRFALNVPAAQLADLEDLPPSPLQLALAREGERRFGAPPAPAGPVTSRATLAGEASASGWALFEERTADLPVAQRELRRLIEIPALGARLYPGATPAERARWIDAAARRVDPEEVVTVRWWEALFGRTAAGIRTSSRRGA